MDSLKEVSSSDTPEDFLTRALAANSASERAHFARLGLDADPDVEPDTEFLLLRQVYLSEIEAHHFHAAAELATRMGQLGGSMEDVAHHDRSRALTALGDTVGAIQAQRLAARCAPPARRSFHCWGLATLLQFVGDYDGAESALKRGERWAHQDRALLRAHRAWVCLLAGRMVEEMAEIIADLESSPARKGYGELVLGMLRHELGDGRRAAVHLRTFVRRNAAIDGPKATTLREELRLARTVLAELESD